MKNTYKWSSRFLLGYLCSLIFIACSDDDNGTTVEPLEPLTAGTADFSTFVAVGNSLTAGFTDNALFVAAQQNSLPNILATQFALAGGGSFTQPLMNDNIGGLLAGGNPVTDPRLVFDGSGPVPLENLVGPIDPTTDIIFNNPTGPFNNMGIPGAKSFHLLNLGIPGSGYGDIAGLGVYANPYFIRMASAVDATVIGDATAQNPTFFSLWIGNNDVLGYATSGGDDSDPITDQGIFDASYTAIIDALTDGSNVEGVVANIPNVTSLPFFTTVPYNAVPLDAGTVAQLNPAFAAYNEGLQVALGMGAITQEEANARTISFQEGQNAVTIIDEDLTDLSGLGLPSYRQATENDLLVLPSSSFIGTVVGGDPTQINGVSVPLGDRWVLTPEEQQLIASATTGFNATIQDAATTNGLAFVDANALLTELSASGLASGNFILTGDLVTGGAFSLDGVHPTARGYALLANEFMKAIDAVYGSNFEASGNLVNIGNYPTNYSPALP